MLAIQFARIDFISIFNSSLTLIFGLEKQISFHCLNSVDDKINIIENSILLLKTYDCLWQSHKSVGMIELDRI